MNGEVNEINMSRPVSYYALTKMSKEVQIEYIRSLQQIYNASSGMLSECFGVAKPTVRRLLMSLGLNQDRSVKRATAEQRVAWTQFLAQANDFDTEASQEPEAEAEPVQEPHAVSLDDPVEIDHFTCEVRGTAYAVCKSLISVIGAGAKGQFCITFVPEGGEDDGE